MDPMSHHHERNGRKRRKISSNGTAGEEGVHYSKPPPCTPPPGQDYEVFLSFRGSDTREGFTDHLYNRLNDAGVWVFRDNEELHVGEEIGPELIKAIKASKISIPIISQNYASSEWCLRELAQILKCKKSGQIVIPIFYKVTPSDIRNQTGQFGTSFLLHQQKYDTDDVQKWRKTLKKVASMKGLESNKIANGHEGVLVKIVLRKVIKKLKKANLVVDDNLIGVQDHMKKIVNMVGSITSKRVQVMLIHGMGGIGKTTLAKLIYNHFSNQYNHRSFLPNIRERSSDDKGMVDLQKQLISDILGKSSAEDIRYSDEGINIIKERFRKKKVLILLDDVNHRDQLNSLARESSWFQQGSILIITSRNKDVLQKWNAKLTYALNELDPMQSFQLFCLHAFGRDSDRQSELERIAREIVSITGGLPLAIKVIGSLLFAKQKDEWEDILQKLKETSTDEVMETLKISYDSLKYEEQQIFLDIACFSVEANKEFAYCMWDACKFHPSIHVKNLISLSLIKIGDGGELIMHDQLRDLGKTIVRQESFNHPGKRSRLWDQEDVWEVLNEKQGTKKFEALSLMCSENFEEYDLTSEHFKGLTKLRLLFLEGVSLNGDFNNLLTNLNWLQWRGRLSVKMETMPINFHPKRLVVLDLWNIPITENWSGWSQIEVVKKIKVVRLVSCCHLTATPDFSAFKELEILILQDCPNLTEIHPSIGSVRKTLKTLNVINCPHIEELPKRVGEMERLKELIVNRTSIREIPISNGFMTELRILSAEGCGKLLKLPDSIGSLVKLHTLSLHDCGMLSGVEGIGQLSSLEQLFIHKCLSLERIDDLSHLKKLRKLQLIDCEMLRGVEGIGQLTSLENLFINNCSSLGRIDDLSHLKKLEVFMLFNCYRLIGIEGIGLLTSLKGLLIKNCVSLETMHDLSHLGKLEVLELSNCCKLIFVEGIGQLISLRRLYIRSCPFFNRTVDLSHLKKLNELELRGISRDILSKRLVKAIFNWFPEHPLEDDTVCDLKSIGQLTSLENLYIKECPYLESIGDLSCLKKLRKLHLENCERLNGFMGIGHLTSLKELSIKNCGSHETIYDLSHLKRLRELQFESCNALSVVVGIGQLTSLKVLVLSTCNMLRDVEGIGQLTSLESLTIQQCPSLERIGDLSQLNKLTLLRLEKCEMLSDVEGIDQLTSLDELELDGLPCIKIIGDLSNLKKLKRLIVCNCRSVEGISQLISLVKLYKTESSTLESLSDNLEAPANRQ